MHYQTDKKEVYKKLKVHEIINNSKNWEELNRNMANVPIPRTKGNVFSDDIWLVERNKAKKYTKIVLNEDLKGFFLVIAKVYHILTIYGYFSFNSKSADENLQRLKRVLVKIRAKQPKIISMLQISSETIESIIKEHLDAKVNDKGIPTYSAQPGTVYRDLKHIRNVVKIGEQFLPTFLRMDRVCLSGKVYEDLEEIYNVDLLSRKLNINEFKREAYSFEDLKILIPKSIEMIENGHELIALFKRLKDEDYFIQPEKQHIKLATAYKVIKSYNLSFTDTDFDKLIKQVKKYSNKSEYIQDEHQGKTLITIISEYVSLLESACMIIVLLFTAMRNSELASMQREFKVGSYGDVSVLKKLIHKTASTISGEEHAIPVPKIAITALEILANLATFRDGASVGPIISFSEKNTPMMMKIIENDEEGSENLESRIRFVVSKLPAYLGLSHLTPHQLRHVMAYLLLQVMGKESIELIRYMLGHSSALMTLTYISRHNLSFAEAIKELIEEQSEENLEALYSNVIANKKVYGARAAQFNGQLNDEMLDILFEYYGEGIKDGWLSVLFTPVSICIHDFTKGEKMNCQRGLDMGDLQGVLPAPARCKPGGCSSAIYFEEHVEAIMERLRIASEELGDNEVYKHILENSYFNHGDFKTELEKEYEDVIYEYIADKGRIS